MPHREIVVSKTGQFTAAMGCDGEPVILRGLEEFPQIGFRFEVDGETWVVVADHKSYICERGK